MTASDWGGSLSFINWLLTTAN